MSITSGEGYRRRPLLDVASYGRRGPQRRDRLSAPDIEHIRRTVRRTPEVMVKVLNRGGQDVASVAQHLAYLSRHGDLDIETDDGQSISGPTDEKALTEDWDLDLEATRRRATLDARPRQRQPKLVHKLVFSMPAGTSPVRVYAAVQNFAREEFGLQHRYAMVLHTDEPHPHVHVVVKAMSEQGRRLNIKRETLRAWRAKFAAELRRQGIAANATERAVRGLGRTQKLDGIYRAERRGYSSHMSERRRSVARDLQEVGSVEVGPGWGTLRATRQKIDEGWRAIAHILVGQGEVNLAREIGDFHSRLPPPMTEREWTAARLPAQMRTPERQKSAAVPVRPPPTQEFTR